MNEQPLITYEYGAMSSKYSLQAKNKLTAYSVMLLHYENNNHMVAIYAPEEAKKDNWLNPFGKIADRLEEIFGGDCEDYIKNNIDEIRECYKTITKIV